MSDVEYDSDEEIPIRNTAAKKLKKDVVRKAPVVDEYDSDEDAYQSMLLRKPEEENDFERQLRLEKEEAERLKEQAEKKTKIDPDGTEYEWDPAVKGWFPKIADKQFFEYQQQNFTFTAAAVDSQKPVYDKKLLENTFYRFNEQFYVWDFDKNEWKTPETNAIYAYVDYMTGVQYEWNQGDQEWQAKVKPVASTSEKKNKSEETAQKKKEGWVDVNEDKNTNVYVSGLPLDVTDEEFEEMMSKYGIIMKDVLTHKLKCKLYRSEDNEVKGDGRCCYLMVINKKFLKNRNNNLMLIFLKIFL